MSVCRAATTSSEGSPSTPGVRSNRTLYVVGVACLVLLAFVIYGFNTFNAQPPATTSTTSETTSYDVLATSVISGAAGYLPSGYSMGSSGALSPNETGLDGAGYAIYSSQTGAYANMTVMVFGSQPSALGYAESVISNAKTLGGYTNTNSTLSAYSHFGVCFGYAEGDPAGGEYVANGVCTKGNVYIMVHLAATSSLASAEGDAAGFVGAAYRALG
ncbi:MAG: hypothetical protein JRN23_06260 [Nitrososphaerota archaeon]|nr:hypothetical protein [Nitrososphaerota archaeon]MDG6967347.1 hypothetical protein [Nitrososphaerota archaeon]MDG6978425.1 hypothetical protein [Nitrososphaerota archaeon]MDG6981154.1 hypothetical protein [Nitrososphaerota archaeon]MDG7021516.1 hypothetical protein [Nitrososphaerota archaeon]